jgi:hypothetical protein
LKIYRLFRLASFSHTLTALIWTLLIVIPYPPFNYLLPIIEKGGPGIWFLFGYLIYLIAGPVGFGTVSALIKTIEIDENAHINEVLAKIGFYLSYAGVLLSSILLAVAGALGGYYMYFIAVSPSILSSILSRFIIPITLTTVAAVLGYLMILLSMMLAKHEQ